MYLLKTVKILPEKKIIFKMIEFLFPSPIHKYRTPMSAYHNQKQ